RKVSVNGGCRQYTVDSRFTLPPVPPAGGNAALARREGGSSLLYAVYGLLSTLLVCVLRVPADFVGMRPRLDRDPLHQNGPAGMPIPLAGDAAQEEMRQPPPRGGAHQDHVRRKRPGGVDDLRGRGAVGDGHLRPVAFGRQDLGLLLDGGKGIG